MRAIIFLFLIIFLLVITFVGYLAYLNPGDVSFYLVPEKSLQIPTTALVLLSMAMGGFMVIMVAGFIEARRLVSSWQSSRVKKRDTRMAELLHQGLSAKASSRHEEAVTLFEKVLQIDSGHVPALIILGDLQRSQGNLREALKLHQTAKAKDHKNIEVLLSLARDLKASKRHEEAVQILQDILRIDKDCLTAFIRLSVIFVNLGQWDKALEIQERISKADLSSDEMEEQRLRLQGIKYEMGKMLMEKGRYDQARHHFRGSIKLDKNYVPAHVGLGDSLLAEGKKDDAVKQWEEAYYITGNIILLHRLEDLHLSTGQPARILDFYQAAVQKDSGNVALQFYLGKLYYRLEMVDEAMDVLSTIDMGGNQIPDVHKLMGNLYLQKGEMASAVEEFKKALNLRKRLLIPYFCPVCDYHTTHWSGRCPRCQNWNTFIASPIIKKEIPAQAVIRARP